MLNDSLVVTQSAGNFKRTYINPEDGAYHAVCVDVLDLGESEKTYENNGVKSTKTVREVKFLFQVDELITEEMMLEAKNGEEISEKEREFIGKRMLVSSRAMSFGWTERSNLYKFIKEWLGREFTPAEQKSFNIESMIGQNAKLLVTNKEVGDNTYCNIASIGQPKKGKTKLEVEGYVRKKIRDAERAAAKAAGTTPATTGSADDVPQFSE